MTTRGRNCFPEVLLWEIKTGFRGRRGLRKPGTDTFEYRREGCLTSNAQEKVSKN